MNDWYAKSGVNIKKGNEVVKRIKKAVAATHNRAVLRNIGSFGGLYDLSPIIKNYKRPVLVQSIDGVGTKLSVAKMMNKYDTVGADIVNHSCNDVLAMGARPMLFLDYVANERLEPEVMTAMVKGMAKACKASGVALIGGETAEMPGVYQPGEHDIAGAITGIVEKNKIITGERIQRGDLLLGLPSSGLHTNGYSLARALLFGKAKHTVKTRVTELGGTVGEILLRVHRNYCQPIFKLQDNNIDIRGIAHITGGGFVENIPRILPKKLNAKINKGSWPMLPIFPYLQKIGRVSEKEMYRVFNMGIGLIVVIPRKQRKKTERLLKNYKSFWIGEITTGQGKVIFQ